MSNIQDITSLSDLLNTSPRQPKEDAVPSSDHLLHQPAEVDPQITDDIGDLLSFQKQKLALSEKRNQLIKRRVDLRDEIESLRVSNKLLLDQRKRKIAKQKSIEREQEKQDEKQGDTDSELHDTPSEVIAHKDDDLVLKNLNVLPSNDWVDRLKYAKMFYPSIEVVSPKIQENDGEDTIERDVRSITFSVLSESFLKLDLLIKINKRDNSLKVIQATKKEQLITLSLLSSSYYNILTRNYLPNKKLNLIMYSLNSLAEMVSERKRVLQRLTTAYFDYVVEEPSTTPAKNSIYLQINPECKLNFVWDIALDKTIAGEVESNLMVNISSGDNLKSHLQSTSATDVLLRLVHESDVFTGICAFLKNTYQLVQVEQ